jgi:hypothetical protein
MALELGCSTDESPTGVIPNPVSQNYPPNVPKNPYPADNAIGMMNYIVFNWTCSDPNSDDILTYHIYLWPNSNNLNIDSASIVETTSIMYNNLENGTLYCWKIKAQDNHGAETISPIWKFTTAAKQK